MEEIPNIQLQVEIKHAKNIVDKEDKILHDLNEWILKVSKKNPLIGGFEICPFASKHTYKIVFSSINDIQPLDEEFGVVIFVIEDDLDLDTINKKCKELSKLYPRYSFFEDCRDESSFIGDVQTNNGKYNLILYQNRNLLRKVREKLAQTEYYGHWNQEYLRHILEDDYDIIK